MAENLHSIQDEKIISQSFDEVSNTKKMCLQVFVSEKSDFFDGHFPSFKIFPAVAQIYLVDLFAKKYFGAEGFVKEIKRVKFPSPMLPETSVLLNLEYNEQKRSLFFTLCDAFQKDKIFSSGTAFL